MSKIRVWAQAQSHPMDAPPPDHNSESLIQHCGILIIVRKQIIIEPAAKFANARFAPEGMMAKTSNKTGAAKAAGSMKNFEERLERLESLGELIRKTDVPLEDALKAFEEGIRLARSLETDLEKIESRIEVLMNSAEAPLGEAPDLELFEANE